jgi:hypothetical protein
MLGMIATSLLGTTATLLLVGLDQTVFLAFDMDFICLIFLALILVMTEIKKRIPEWEEVR